MARLVEAFLCAGCGSLAGVFVDDAGKLSVSGCVCVRAEEAEIV